MAAEHHPIASTDVLPVTGNTEQTRPENRAFFPALDGLRAVAFLMVFFQHYYFLPWGWTGVNIFFVLSGFLITGILLDTRSDPHRARNFYVRRTLRIFPLYYGIFFALLLLQPVFHWSWSLWWLAWPLYVGNFLRIAGPSLVVHNSPLNLAANAWLGTPLLPRSQIFLGHLWSLCVEEQFYLVWPWMVFWIRSRRTLVWLCVLSVPVVLTLRLLGQHFAPAWMQVGSHLFNVTPFQLDALLLGALLALLWRLADHKVLLAAGRAAAVCGGVVAACYLACSIHPHAFPTWREGYVYPVWNHTWGSSFVDLLAAALVLCCLAGSGWLVRLLGLRPLRWLGRISYGAYVFHDIFHDLYVHTAIAMGHHSRFCALHRDELAIVLGLTSTLIVAWLSFRFFETPFLNLKERWTIRS